VRAYAWPNSPKVTGGILPGMKLQDGVLNREGQVLTAAEVKLLTAAVTGKHPVVSIAACYVPHNAFVFYDAAKKPVAFIEVCFACLRWRTEPAGAAPNVDLAALARLFTAHQLPMGQYADADSFLYERARTEQLQDEAMKKLQSR
jgi:hypothetical protein